MKTDKPLQNVWMSVLERSFNIIIPILAILMAFLVSGILILAWGSNPIEAYISLFSGAFGSPNAWGTTLTRLTPLVFTGLAVAYGYRSGFFNVGAEGQLFMGGLAATWVGVTFIDLPGVVLIPLCMLAAMLAGSLMCLIPGFLKAARGFNEVLTTLLLNYIAIQYFEWALRIDHPMRGIDQAWTLVNWLGIKDPSQPFPKSAVIAEAAWLPSIKAVLSGEFFAGLFSGQEWYIAALKIPALERFTLAPVIAVIFLVIVYFLLFKTTIGYQARAVGINPEAARYMGINVNRTIIITSLISGALAGMAGGMEVMGAQHRVIERYIVDAGFTGIPVALIGQLHPFGVGLSALFFGALRAGANKMQIITAVPIAVVYVIQALAILFAISGTLIDLQSRIKIARLSKQSHVDSPAVKPNEVPNV